MEIRFILESIGTNQTYKVGDVADLGEKRNESAVERGRAVFIKDIEEIEVVAEVVTNVGTKTKKKR
jgi:hypothetical protein